MSCMYVCGTHQCIIPTTVTYPAHSAVSIGHFIGGNCLITLSSTALTISSLGNRTIATWPYSNIDDFHSTPAFFGFTSNYRGPYGVQTYTFDVTLSVKSSLLSALSAYKHNTVVESSIPSVTNTNSNLYAKISLHTNDKNESKKQHRTSLPDRPRIDICSPPRPPRWSISETTLLTPPPRRPNSIAVPPRLCPSPTIPVDLAPKEPGKEGE